VSASFTDPGTLDTHTAMIDWRDGFSETLDLDPQARALTAGHSYEFGGVYTVTLTLADDDTGADVVTGTVAVTGAGVNYGVLQIIGTPEDDHVTIAGSIELPTLVDGSARNNHLSGGSGPNVLLGGPDDDMLIGGRGRDVLIGDAGLDRIVANGGQDILIGGPTVYDSDPVNARLANDEALMAILAEWNADRDFGVRVANLTDGSGSPDRLNGDFFLLLDETVLDDEEADEVTGSAGEDWFLLFEDDVITDGASQSKQGGKKK